MIHAEAFPTAQPARPRYVMIEGQPRHVRSDNDLVDALVAALVDATITTGSACEGDLINLGFTRAELTTHLPKARERATRALRAKAV